MVMALFPYRQRSDTIRLGKYMASKLWPYGMRLMQHFALSSERIQLRIVLLVYYFQLARSTLLLLIYTNRWLTLAEYKLCTMRMQHAHIQISMLIS
jgi:hypothetical protein